MLKNTLSFAALVVVIPSLALASYTVVLKDGTRYRAKEKWRMSGGKAMVTLENGTTLSLDPKLIDEKESENRGGARPRPGPENRGPLSGQPLRTPDRT